MLEANQFVQVDLLCRADEVMVSGGFSVVGDVTVLSSAPITSGFNGWHVEAQAGPPAGAGDKEEARMLTVTGVCAAQG